MEDNSGKKFSLQDWVMKRAANQSGVAMPSLSSRMEAMENAMEEETRDENPVSVSVEVEMKSVSNGASISSSSIANSVTKDIMKDIAKEIQKEVSKEISKPEEIQLNKKEESKDFASALTGTQNPIQQLQVVKLLTDLGDRLRQSEKEREVLWKEVEICRKQIADMSSTNNKSEKSYAHLETQINQREVFVKELVEKQLGLEQQMKDQLAAFQTSQAEQTKLQDKLTSVETATGSAIVRVEDVVAENSKLAKRVEQLSQDKVRLVRKLEVVEDALTQTQEILKAKALVLLTDHAIANKTSLPQTPAWTGDDTLKMSAPREQTSPQSSPASSIANSLRPPQPVKSNLWMVAILTALFSCLAAYGVIWAMKNINKTTDTIAVPEIPVGTSQQQSQEQLMAQIAKAANQIEPGGLTSGDELSDDMLEPTTGTSEFESALVAQDKAVDDFKQTFPQSFVVNRFKADKSLPKSVRDIESVALTGDASAQHDLAAIYTAGHGGVKINYAKAAQWFEEAAHNGSANAQYNLGVLYHQGLGVEKSTEKAIQMYRVAANNKHPEALYNLAIAYVEGVGVEYNPQIASVYFERAAEGGIVEAAYNMGLLHENGLLGESQPDEAVFWYKIAADKGNPDALKALQKIKTQLTMNDEDITRISQKIALQKEGFINADGKASLPDMPKKSAAPQKSVTPETPKSSTPAQKTIQKPVAKINTSIPTPVTDPVIVSQIQEQLTKMGLYRGVPNGEISSVLSQAIKTYQQKNGMKIDGQPSDDLLVQMLASNTEIQN